MEFETNTGVEVPEVADQVDETGVEDQEVAAPESTEPEHQKNSSDAAFAEMRRAQEAAQKELADARAELDALKAHNEARDEAFNRLTGSEDGQIAALAEVTGMSEDEIRAEMEAAEESAQKDYRIEQLERQLESVEVEKVMQEHLSQIQKVDPSVQSLESLGDGYVDYIRAGLDPVKAYWALKAESGANHREPPKPAGKVATGTAEKDYYTDAEIDAMSSEQLTKNWKKIMASWDRNG